MKIKFLLLCQILCAYQDEELDQLWSQIPDIYHPRVEDFLLIENYIAHGERLYLDPLCYAEKDLSQEVRLNRIREFKMIGPNGELPLFEIHKINEREETKKRCILIYGSHNHTDLAYSEYARRAVRDLEQVGYSGHILLRIGGFPNIDRGSLRYSFVPYAFKVAFFQEARVMGYEEILWVDSAIHPLRNLEFIFDYINRDGYFFMSPSFLQASYFPKTAADALGIAQSLYPEIPHIQSGILGLNMKDERAKKLLDDWEYETEQVLPNITFFPEELSLSAVAWRLGLKPTCSSWEIFCIGHEIRQFDVFRDRPHLQFYVGEL